MSSAVLEQTQCDDGNSCISHLCSVRAHNNLRWNLSCETIGVEKKKASEMPHRQAKMIYTNQYDIGK